MLSGSCPKTPITKFIENNVKDVHIFLRILNVYKSTVPFKSGQYRKHLLSRVNMK